MKLELTEAERAALTVAERALVAEIEAEPDPVEPPDDNRFGSLPYDEVLDGFGRPVP